MTEDKRNRFEQDVFTYRVTKEGKVFLYWEGKQVMILKADKAIRFLKKIESLNNREIQLVIAKLTGNFKRGNERP